MRHCLFFLLNVVLPTAIGASIYCGYRPTTLVVFRWIDAIGATDVVIRPSHALPDWVLYSLPDGCWVYAYTSWMLLIWNRIVPWVCTGLLLAVGGEVGQLLALVPGTYDTVDLLFYITAFILAGAIHAKTPFLRRGTVGDGLSSGRQRTE